MFSKKNVMWWFAVLLWFSIFSCFAYEMTEQERLWAWINCWESTDSWCSQTKRRYEEQVKGKTEIEMLNKNQTKCKLEKKDATQDDFYNYRIQTEAFEKAKNYSGAISCLEELWKIDPSHINVWFKMWINYANMWEYEKALGFYKKLDEFWPLSEDKKLAVKHFVEEAEKMLKLENKVKEKNKELEAQKNEIDKKQAELESKSKESKESKEIQEAKLETKAETKNSKLPSEIELVKTTLGSKASIIESLLPIIKARDETTQNRIKAILEGFMASKDEYTRNVGVYLNYLLK